MYVTCFCFFLLHTCFLKCNVRQIRYFSSEAHGVFQLLTTTSWRERERKERERVVMKEVNKRVLKHFLVCTFSTFLLAMEVVWGNKPHSHDAVVLRIVLFWQKFSPTGRKCTPYLKILKQQLRLFSTLCCKKRRQALSACLSCHIHCLVLLKASSR